MWTCGAPLENFLDQISHCVEDVLAAVEHQQHPLVLQECNQVGDWMFGTNTETERRRERTCHQPRTSQRSQVNEPNSAVVRCEKLFGDGDGHRGFSDPARPDDRDELSLPQPIREGSHDVGAANHAREERRQVMIALGGSRRNSRRLLRVCREHRCNEPIAATNLVDNVACTRLTVPEQFAEVRRHEREDWLRRLSCSATQRQSIPPC